MFWLCPNTFILPYPIAGYAPHMRALGRKAIWIGTNDITKLFAIHKIRNAVLTDEPFSLPNDFSYKNLSGNGRFGAFVSKK